MNALRITQIVTLIILKIDAIKSEIKYLESNEECEVKPSDVDKVEVLIYLNGETKFDSILYERYCAWRDAGFPYDKYAPVTIHAGAAITCDNNNKCICPNETYAKADCKLTFEHVCAEQILGQEEFRNFLCCTKLFINKETKEVYGYKRCVDKFGLADKITACLNKTGDGCPREIALKNAQEVIAKGADTASSTEPYFFYNGIFESCISDHSPELLIQKICQMLKVNIAKGIPDCVYAMGWTES